MPELWGSGIAFWVLRLIDILMKAEVARGCAYADGSLAGWGCPLLILGGPVLELARGYVKRYGFRISGVEVDAIESYE